MALFSSSVEDFRRAMKAIDTVMLAQKDLPAVVSPYRLLSLPEVKKEPDLCAIISEEICELALPALLDQGRDLLAAARRRQEITRFREDLEGIQAKLDLLSGSVYLDRLKRAPSAFGFVSYPGYLLVEPAALIERYPRDSEAFFEWAYPVLYELEGARRAGEALPGWLAFYFVKPAVMRLRPELVRKKTLQAVLALSRLNVRIAGLGGLSASLTGGGHDLVGQTGDCAVTTGHNYTAVNMVRTLKLAAAAKRKTLEGSVIAILGAAGSVGSGLAQLCAAEGKVGEIILIDERPVNETLSRVQSFGTRVRAGRTEDDIQKADFILVATSSNKILFGPGQLKYGSVVIDDSQPKNVSQDLLKERPDVLLLEGGATEPPRSSYGIHRAFGPRLKAFSWGRINNPLAGPDEIPCCLAEAYLWSLMNEKRRSYSLGRPDMGLMTHLDQEAERLGFGPGKLQAFGKMQPIGNGAHGV